ncbi:heterokaryon incompatibility protein-domain-containing protein [Xylaria digitata]|nr:heterokaryon incompatibility protein-domain-containing protein [Xylaria digitata]
MRLLRAADLHFEEFEGDDIPRYAILSHRWEQDEVSYRDMFKATKAGEIPSYHPIWRKQGFQKIYNFSQRALREDFEYIWVDTCCINKESSAELQEAINSMFRWYQDSGACFAYLSDVSVAPGDANSPGDDAEPGWMNSFKESQWFTRGWTLQELLAPRQLIFFDRDWNECDAADALDQEIYDITGIDIREVSSHPRAEEGEEGTSLQELQVGQRMSWAVHRETTRVEDRAYSLLGVFNINMPLLYGEGKRSFQRLQEEIMQVDDDVSILAWSCTSADADFAPNGLARWPTNFHRYTELVDGKNVLFARHSLTMTQRGLQATLRIQRDPNDKMLAYVVLANTIQFFSHKTQHLVLPILFLQHTPQRPHVKNDCVRFSDPQWVAFDFAQGAKLEPLCFVRHLQPADTRFYGDGLSLSADVWRDYVPVFTYPAQAQPGRRHFPAVLGNVVPSPDAKKKNCTLIIELKSRFTEPDAPQRYIVLVEGLLQGSRGLQSSLTVLVARVGGPVDLGYALRLVKRGSARRKLVPCELRDRNGQVIPGDEIVQFQYFPSYWVHGQGDDSAELSPARGARRRAGGRNNAKCIVC